MTELFSNFITFMKPFFLFAVTGIVSVFSPLHDVFLALIMSFIFNIVTGIIADVHVNKEDFKIKKAFEAIVHLTFYVALVLFIHNIAVNLGDLEAGRIGVKWATYIVVYFYLTNILRNASLVYPKNAAITFMYMVLTTQIFAKLKELIGIKDSTPTDSTPTDKSETL